MHVIMFHQMAPLSFFHVFLFGNQQEMVIIYIQRETLEDT